MQETSTLERLLGELAGPLNRRDFMTASASGATALSFASLARRAEAAVSFTPDYGPLAPVADDATGLNLISLPNGFSYSTFGWTDDVMSDGNATPYRHDGMGVVARRGNTISLVRNHEVGDPNLAGTYHAPTVYDPLLSGGTTNLLFDTLQGRWLASWGSLAGTTGNCAGGVTPWGTWLSCEETVAGPDTISQAEIEGLAAQAGLPVDVVAGLVAQLKTHGWVFEVPGFGVSNAEPLRGLGRFVHEAVAVDPVTSIVYETEDATPSGIYRFIPDAYGNLAGTGKLQMLKVKDVDNFNFGGLDGNYPSFASGQSWDIEWVDIANPEPDFASANPAENTSVFDQGFALGGASFARGEGAWFDGGKMYFTSTSGGAARKGQVYEYDPRTQRLTMLFESAGAFELDNPDNITVSPRGGIVLCEDGGDNLKLRGLTPDGRIFPFAQNVIDLSAADVASAGKSVPAGDYTGQEWCGATFHDRWLFVNIQTPGVTFAITGPWNNGAL